MKLYIAGAILNAPGHTLDFSEAERMLREHGYETVNPTKVAACSNKNCWSLGTRLTPWLRGPGSKEHTYECYIRFDLIEMFLCEGVCYLPGWETSFGARNEINQAAMVGMKVESFAWWIELAEDAMNGIHLP